MTMLSMMLPVSLAFTAKPVQKSYMCPPQSRITSIEAVADGPFMSTRRLKEAHTKRVRQ